MTTQDQINAVLKDINAYDRGSYYDPRSLSYEWTRKEGCTYRLVSPIKSSSGRQFSAYIKNTDDSERIREIACGLIARAIDQHEADQLAEQRGRERAAVQEAKEKQEQLEWINLVRVAFGGNAGEALPADLKPRVFSDQQLVDAGKANWSGGYSIKVPLPLDLDKRAEFLAKLDALVASLS